MYAEEIIHAIGLNHTYEYCIVNSDFKLLQHSEGLLIYCDLEATEKGLSLFDIVPEFTGMEQELASVFDGSLRKYMIPLVFKEPSYYVNIHIHASTTSPTIIVLFENITETTVAQQFASQVHNENLLLLQDVAEKNKQLKDFNEEMQRLVSEEVEKNLEKQHMLELQTRHAQMGEMISLITHQWKQPLSVIQTVGTLLKMKQEMGKLTSGIFLEKIENILKQAEHMKQTVNDFQKFFTPSKKRDFFHVKKTIESVLELVKMDYELHNIKIILEGDDEVEVKGYANEFKQVILSIIQNSKDAFTGQQNGHKYIKITVLKEKEYSIVRIADNAGGIPEEIIDEIFTQYVTSKRKGSGLGLYIAKSVIENNMQGKLCAVNLQEGAEFSIRL